MKGQKGSIVKNGAQVLPICILCGMLAFLAASTDIIMTGPDCFSNNKITISIIESGLQDYSSFKGFDVLLFYYFFFLE